MEILRCEGVRKIYGAGANQVTALDGISLSVKKGEIHAASYPGERGPAHRRKGAGGRRGYHRI